MTKLNTHLRKWIERISEEIEGIEDEGEVAEPGVNVVYYFPGRESLNGYYRLVSKEPIFKGKNGKMVTTQHLGDEYSLKAREAIASVNRRKKIKVLEKLFAHMEKSLYELESIDR
jgi:hypothetical protein